MGGAAAARRRREKRDRLKRTKNENRDDEADKKDGEKAGTQRERQECFLKPRRARRRTREGPLFQFSRLLAAALQSSSSFSLE